MEAASYPDERFLPATVFRQPPDGDEFPPDYTEPAPVDGRLHDSGVFVDEPFKDATAVVVYPVQLLERHTEAPPNKKLLDPPNKNLLDPPDKPPDPPAIEKTRPRSDHTPSDIRLTTESPAPHIDEKKRDSPPAVPPPAATLPVVNGGWKSEENLAPRRCATRAEAPVSVKDRIAAFSRSELCLNRWTEAPARREERTQICRDRTGPPTAADWLRKGGGWRSVGNLTASVGTEDKSDSRRGETLPLYPRTSACFYSRGGPARPEEGLKRFDRLFPPLDKRPSKLKGLVVPEKPAVPPAAGECLPTIVSCGSALLYKLPVPKPAKNAPASEAENARSDPVAPGRSDGPKYIPASVSPTPPSSSVSPSPPSTPRSGGSGVPAADVFRLSEDSDGSAAPSERPDCGRYLARPAAVSECRAPPEYQSPPGRTEEGPSSDLSVREEWTPEANEGSELRPRFLSRQKTVLRTPADSTDSVRNFRDLAEKWALRSGHAPALCPVGGPRTEVGRPATESPPRPKPRVRDRWAEEAVESSVASRSVEVGPGVKRPPPVEWRRPSEIRTEGSARDRSATAPSPGVDRLRLAFESRARGPVPAQRTPEAPAGQERKPRSSDLTVVLEKPQAAGGVGIALAGGIDCEVKDVTIHKVIGGSLADRDGRLRKGDRILEVNGRQTDGLTHRDARALLKEPCDRMELVVCRAPDGLPEVATSEPTNEGRGRHLIVQLLKEGAGLGFGIEGGKDSPLGDRPLLVKRIFKGGAADREGSLKAGDELLSVNGQSLGNMTRTEAWNYMKKLPDGSVTLTVRVG